MVSRVSSGVSEVEYPVCPVGSAWRRGNVGIRNGEVIDVLVGARERSNGRRDVQVNWADKVVRGHEQVSYACGESLANFAVNFEAGLLGIGLSQVSIHGCAALDVRLVGREYSLGDEVHEIVVNDVHRNRP